MEGMNTTGRKLTASKLYEVSRVFINVDTDGRWKMCSIVFCGEVLGFLPSHKNVFTFFSGSSTSFPYQ